jgi:galactokinase
MENLALEVQHQFTKLYKTEPLLVRSPGRINLIGEHTDYNDGFVMPAAIDKSIIFGIAESKTNQSQIFSLKYNQSVTVDLSNPGRVEEPGWANFMLGVLFQLLKGGQKIKNFNCVFGGEVPLGAGLSSSAALECGFGYALIELFQLDIPKLRLVKMAQWAEHNYVGVKCGIMDQFASVMGKENHVILLDCRSLNYSYTPFDLKDNCIVLCDSRVKHSLVDSEYNRRREECEKGVSILKQYYPEVNSLRDATVNMLNDHRHEFSERVFNRCSYVVQEIERVQAASDDLKNGDLKNFGAKMFETHEGLSKLYEVSCKELDFLVNEARQFNYVSGARMMGGGFGGCTINIVNKEKTDEFIDHQKKVYGEKFLIEMLAYKVSIVDGTSVLTRTTAPFV